MSTQGRILVTPRSLTAPGVEQVPELAPLRDAGYELISPAPGSVPGREALLELVPDCVGWLAGIERIDAAVLEAAPQLRVISRNGAGTDSIDLEAAERAGVRVERAAGANAQGVAELILALTLCALRGIVPAATSLRAGTWERQRGDEIADRHVGVIGLGAVGVRTAGIFRSLGAEVRGHDPYAEVAGLPQVELDALLGRCDVISLSCPPTTTPLLGADRLELVPRGTILVNTARSALVDDEAVLAALDSGQLAAYAVDAFDTEPPPSSALLQHSRVLATPHVGGYTHSSVRRATTGAVDNLLTALDSC